MKQNAIKRWLVLLFCATMLATPFASALAADALPSGLADADLASVVDAYVDANRDTTAAVSVAITRGQQTLLEQAYGYADVEAGRAADADTVYEWGSATKLLVWVSVIQLVEQGQLDLEADIRTYLPDGFLTKLRYNTPITMMHLMHHNAGWEDVLVGLFVSPSAKIDNLEKTLRHSEPNQIFEPGTVCAYSNWGVSLAALVVERISGEPFTDYVHNHIFAPLDMERTALSPTLEDNAWVREHRPLTHGYMGVDPIQHQFAIPLYPAGMATGTLGDFLRFAQALLPEEGAPSPLFTRADTLPALLTPTLFYGNGDARNSHGFWVADWVGVDAGAPIVGHGGNTAAFSSMLIVDPVSNIGVVVMTNQSGETVYNYDLPELLFGKPSPVPATEAMPDARELRGLYRMGRTVQNGCVKLYDVMTLVPLFGGDENTLSTSFLGQSMKLNQLRPDLFVVDEGSTIDMPIDTFRAERTTDGGARLAVMIFDFVRIPTSEGVWAVAVLLLLVLAIGYCAVALIGGGIRRLILRLRKRRGETSPLRKAHLTLCALGLAQGINIVWMFGNLMTFASKTAIGLHIAFTWLYTAAVMGYPILLAIKAHKADSSRKEKALYLWTGVAAVAILLNIMVWQFYRF